MLSDNRHRTVVFRCLVLLSCAGYFSLSTTASGLNPAGSPERRPAWTTSRLRGTPEPPFQFRIESAFPAAKFDHPTCLLEIPGTGQLLITELSGRILSLSSQTSHAQAPRVMADLRALAGGDVSLFGAALHPDFAANGFLFVCLVHPEGGPHTRVSRFELKTTPALSLVPQSERVIITWPSGGHNGGCLRFGPDGMLYISTGDGSGPNPPDGLTSGQTVDDLLGAILRIDVNHVTDQQNYVIPSDNPFRQLAGARPEIFAYGLRNPWKFGIDSETGNIFVADNGWETWEMVHLVTAGTNCGWPIMEGRARLRTEVTPGPTPITPPIRDHHHSEANSVIGGPVYHGTQLPDLNGWFVYGDYITGTVWALKQEPDGSYSGRTLLDTDLRIVDFLLGSGGELYVLDYDLTGQIYQILPQQVEDLSADFPRRLSETGLFSSTAELEPAPGVVGYDIVAPRWTDGAVAQRWVAVPGISVIRLSDQPADPMMYPEGTVFAKLLSIPASGNRSARRLETQILHLSHGVCNPYSYLWNEQETDAELVSSVGTAVSVGWPDPETADRDADNSDSTSASSSGSSLVSAQPGVERTWRVGAVNECRLCHNAGPGFVLGFSTAQLSQPVSHGGAMIRQADLLARQAVIVPNEALTDLPRPGPGMPLVDPGNPALDLNDRARSWLHANCSMCHHRGGNAIVSIFLSRDLPFDQMNTNKGTGIGTFGIPEGKIIEPGDPYRSVLFYRVSRLGNSRMPYVGSHVVDSAGVALLEQWIRSLPAAASARRSPPVVPDSAEFRSLRTLDQPASDADTAAAVRQLTGSTEGSLALAARLHSGSLPKSVRRDAVTAAAAAGSDVRGLFDHFVPESERKKTLGRSFDPSLVLSLQGDAQRGHLIFFSDSTRCRTCHHLADPLQSVGPTLAEISRKYVHRSELLQHIMEPSLKIDEKFATWIALTTDGRQFSGLLHSRSDREVALQTAERRVQTMPRQEIEELLKSNRSLMPDGVLGDLTAQEAADLLEFIRTVSPPVDSK